MYLLAIETATEGCSAALWHEGAVTGRFQVAPREHAGLIFTMLDELLAEAGIGRAAIDALAFGRGPGSFTGVRIAAGVVQGIALGRGLPVVPVSTLAVLAQGAVRSHGAQAVLAAIDARMGEIYFGAFLRGADGLVQPAGEERVCRPDAVAIPEGEGWFGAGTGWGSYGAVLAAAAGGRLAGSDGGLLPRAVDLAPLAAAAWARGEALPPEQALPTYLRDQVVARPGGGG